MQKNSFIITAIDPNLDEDAVVDRVAIFRLPPDPHG